MTYMIRRERFAITLTIYGSSHSWQSIISEGGERESLADFQVLNMLEQVISSVDKLYQRFKGNHCESTWVCLECMENKVVWIVGGIDKGNVIQSFRLSEKVRAVYAW